MARKRKVEEHENHERWLVSYADFITLLFAFFVVMYSISSVNEGKYRVLSSSMVSAFSQPAQSIAPIRYGQDLKSPVIQHKVIMENDTFDRIGIEYEVMPTMKEVAKMEMISDEVEKKLRPLVEKDIVSIHKTNKGVEIEIKSNILFGSGQAVLQKSAKPPLQQIALVLGKLKNPVNVEGFTDNQPIHTLVFPSNWELSAARAANVVHLFTQLGIAPDRMTAIGYGEFKPVASNDTAEGREKNRRINIIVLNRKIKDRQRLGALDNSRPLSKLNREQLNPIGDSIRKVMGQGGLVIPLPVIAPGAKQNEEPGFNGKKPLIPNTLGANNAVGKGNAATNNNADDKNRAKAKNQKPKLLRLPPPTMLPLGKGDNP